MAKNRQRDPEFKAPAVKLANDAGQVQAVWEPGIPAHKLYNLVHESCGKPAVGGTPGRARF